jgi:hypothetical protein
MEPIQLNELEPDLIIHLYKEGYTNLKMVNNQLCGIKEFIFTFGVCCDMDKHGYRYRFCFSDKKYALDFLDSWDGETLPMVGVNGCTAIK